MPFLATVLPEKDADARMKIGKPQQSVLRTADFRFVFHEDNFSSLFSAGGHRHLSPGAAGTGSSQPGPRSGSLSGRSEEHTSELQSRLHLVCRLLLEKKKLNR